jgi:hypothetical protein
MLRTAKASPANRALIETALKETQLLRWLGGKGIYSPKAITPDSFRTLCISNGLSYTKANREKCWELIPKDLNNIKRATNQFYKGFSKLI